MTIDRDNALGVLLKECDKVIATAPFNTVRKLDLLVREIRKALKKPYCRCITTREYEGGYGMRTVVVDRNHCPMPGH